MPAELYNQVASCRPKLSSWINGTLLITTHPVPIRLGTQGPGPAIFVFCTIAIKKYKWERKTWKNIVSVMESVLLILFCWDVLLIFYGSREGTSDFRLRTSDFRLQASDFRLQTSDFRLQTSDFRLQTSDFRLQTSDFGLQTLVPSFANSQHCFCVPLRITLFLLYFLLYTVSYLFKCICRLRNIK
jgi:hypothetical protein